MKRRHRYRRVLEVLRNVARGPLLITIEGPQGAGKSVLAGVLSTILGDAGVPTAVDDVECATRTIRRAVGSRVTIATVTGSASSRKVGP